MVENLLIGIASILFFGIGAQWLAWRTKLPAILLLLIAGIFAGPVLGIVSPDTILGEAFSPFIALSVGVILFEGGLSLKFSELENISGSIIKLVSVGVLTTWIITSVSSFYLFDFGIELSVLTGAILVVTGPTVIIPLLRQVRPNSRINALLKWEGIVIDPIGALLAVLVFEVIISSGISTATSFAFFSIVKTVFFGSIIGLAGAGLIFILIKRFMLPDFLENPVALMVVICVFTLSDVLQHESGLWATTVMGIALANQKAARIHHIVEFKENLRVLLLSTLFILLAARVNLGNMMDSLNWQIAAFLAILILLARPLSVYLSTLGSKLSWREKAFISWMAPRGIVAASIASLFAIELAANGYPGAEQLVSIVFIVIISTVAIYGLTANAAANLLGVSMESPKGYLIIGAHPWARELAAVIKDEGIKIQVADTNHINVERARKKGLKTYYGNILAEDAMEEIDLEGIGKLLSITHNDEVNALAALHFREIFSSSGVFQLPPYSQGNANQEIPENLSGRTLFDNNLTFDAITKLRDNGASFKMITLENEKHTETVKQHFGNKLIPLFHFTGSTEAHPFTVDYELVPKPGDKVLCLSLPDHAEIPVSQDDS